MEKPGKKFKIEDVVYRIFTSNQTGDLALTQGGETRHVYFLKGRPVHVSESKTSEPLGRILLEMGYITPDDYDQSLMDMARTGKRQGAILEEMGKITKGQIETALESQLKKKLNKIFFMRDAEITFARGQENLPKNLNLSECPHVSPLTVIYNGIKNSMDLDALEKELRVSGDTLVILSEEFHALSLSLPLSPEEVVITEHLASPASTDKLLALKVLNRTELLMVIYYLSIIELIKLRDPSIHQAQAKAAPPFPEACVDPGPAVGNVDVLGQLHSDYVKQFSKARSAAHDAVGTLSAELMDRFRNIQSLNYYEILGLDPKFYDDTKARRAYVEITRKFHPSNFCDAEGEAARLADILLAKSNDAYSTLSNPALKNEYDTSLRSAEERKKIKTSRSGGAELEFQKGVFFLKKSDFKNALESLKRAVETSGEEADYLAAYGWALYNDPGQPKEVREAMAKRYLRKAVVVNAACSRAMIHLATIARLEGHIEEAWMLIDEASRLGKELELLEAERSELRLMPRPQAITSTTSRPAATPPVPSVTTAARPANAPAPDEKKPSGIFSALLGKKKPKG